MISLILLAALQSVHEDWKEIPIEGSVEKGLRWLVSVQGSDGGWGQDGGHQADARQGVNLESEGNDVANTALVALALLRAGNTPAEGPHREALAKAVEFILVRVEKAPKEGLSITDRKGTQIQRKLGPFIDTFLGNLVLSELEGRMGGENPRVRAALEKCVAKIEANQKDDGSWNLGGGWAPIIGTSIASRGLHVAQSKGVAVSEETVAACKKYTERQFDAAKGDFKPGEAGAGVELYQAAQALEESSRTEADRVANEPMAKAVGGKLADASFVGGFGSMGGEEFVSYLNISDSLLRAGGEAWGKWNGKIREHLGKLQNADGTWAGHHCITGRVACTSAAAMTLLAERTGPRP